MNRVDREERIQRIRIGLTGLAFVFLFVLLFAAISRSGEDGNAVPVQNGLAAPDEPNEPLAEIGAAPGTVSDNETGDQPVPAKKVP